MVFQQFGGINGIVFYAGQIFVSAGELLDCLRFFLFELCFQNKIMLTISWSTISGVPPNVGGILYACLQVSLSLSLSLLFCTCYYFNILPQVIVTAFGGSLIDRLGRRPLLIVGTIETILFLRLIFWDPTWIKRKKIKLNLVFHIRFLHMVCFLAVY